MSSITVSKVKKGRKDQLQHLIEDHHLGDVHADDLVAEELDPAEIVYGKILGEGAFGRVFKGTLWGQEIAIKKLEVNDDADFEDFFNEVRVMKTLRHPNIVEFMGACYTPGKMCLVTEFLELGSLEELLDDLESKDEKLNMAQIMHYALDTARGLSWLHHKTIIHRDLKSANLLIDKNNNMKIADFGLSHLKTHINSTGFYGAVGTPCYMAPEVLSNEDYDTRADIFSFGIVLCELVLGRYPLEDDPRESTQTFEQAIICGRRPDVPDGCPNCLGTLMRDCWKNDPNKRPNTDQLLQRLFHAKEELEHEHLIDVLDDLPPKALGMINKQKQRVIDLSHDVGKLKLANHNLEDQIRALNKALKHEKKKNLIERKARKHLEKKYEDLKRGAGHSGHLASPGHGKSNSRKLADSHSPASISRRMKNGVPASSPAATAAHRRKSSSHRSKHRLKAGTAHKSGKHGKPPVSPSASHFQAHHHHHAGNSPQSSPPSTSPSVSPSHSATAKLKKLNIKSKSSVRHTSSHLPHMPRVGRK